MPRARASKLSWADGNRSHASNIRFHVHRDNLRIHSVVFKDMLDVGGAQGDSAEVTLVETAGALERLLPYCYPARVDPVCIEFEPVCIETGEANGFIQAALKYEVRVDKARRSVNNS